MNNDELNVNPDVMKLLAELQAELAELREAPPKNQRPGVAGERNVYVRLGELKTYGRVPQQQADIAKILTSEMVLNQQYSEAEVFNFLINGCGEFRSLYTSKQDVTYLFKYYRGLNKKDGKHEGFVKRGFLQVV